MAEVLEKVLSGEISTDELVKWLDRPVNSESSIRCYKGEFVPHFLNYLRRSTSWLFDNTLRSDSSKDKVDTGTSRVLLERDGNIDGTPVAKTNHESGKSLHVRRNCLQFKKLSNGTEPFTIGCDSYSKRRRSKREPKEMLSLSNENGPALDITDVNAFPPISSSKSEKLKRITPTPLVRKTISVKQSLQTSFSKSGNRTPCGVFCPPYEKNDEPDLVHERDLLKEARNKLVSPTKVNVMKANIQTRKAVKSSSTGPIIEAALPDPSRMHLQEKVVVFVRIYSKLLQGHLPNITTELYFLFQLLTPCTSIEKYSESNVFGSIHNCVYFTVSVLEENKALFELFDNSTLSSLLKIPYLPQFSPNLVDYLSACINDRNVIKALVKSSIEDVAYHEDTDTRKNFPTNECFTSFSKQRDLFHEIFEEWHQNCIKDVWCEGWFKKKVAQLLGLSADPMNFFHLARLIRSQILVSCLQGEDSSVKLEHLRNNFPERFGMLEDRISVQKGNPCPPPAFPGMQSFFEAFLKAADSCSLNSNLQDILAFDIMEINNYDFLTEIQSISAQEKQARFASSLCTVRLLAKFLGYVTFMPYKAQKAYPRHLANAHKIYREIRLPPIDVANVLIDAVNKHHLVLTVPWIVEYLSMMDQFAPLLEHNYAVCKVLVRIYSGQHGSYINNLNFQFIRVMIGWLMENPLFPIECLYQSHREFEEIVLQHENINSLDSQDIVEKSLVYSCCPYLVELRSVLEESEKGERKVPELRKITPLPTNALNNIFTEEQQLQKDLIENFYFLQPAVIKKIVEFSAERVTSQFICEISENIEKLKVKYTSRVCDVVSSQKTPDFKVIPSLAAENSVNLCAEARQWALEHVQRNSYEVVRKLLKFLMRKEFSSAVVRTSCDLTTKAIRDTLLNWIDANIVPDALKNDIRNRANGCLEERIFILSCSAKEEVHVLQTHYLKVLKKIVSEKDFSAESFSVPEFLNLCKEIRVALGEGYLHEVSKALILLINDIIISLIINSPELCCTEVFSEFASFWSMCSFIKVSHILCPANVYYMARCSKGNVSWTKLGEYLDCLLQSRSISFSQVKDCVRRLDRTQWSNTLVASFENCIKHVTRKHIQNK